MDNEQVIIESLGRIVSAYVSNHTVVHSDIDRLVKSIYNSLKSLGKGSPARDLPQSKISKEDSVTPDYIICLEDGKHLKMLKRHLRTSYGLTPQQYRERWSLPYDYPMVAPNYAKKRSALARNYGLGQGQGSSSAVG